MHVHFSLSILYSWQADGLACPLIVSVLGIVLANDVHLQIDSHKVRCGCMAATPV